MQTDMTKTRNIGIIAHIDAGKTTLSERILFYTNKIHRMGEVHNGTATMDYMPEEQERGITITAACTSCQWNDYTINLIDTPGHVDFTIEVERSLRVLDAAIAVFCAVSGVQPQSETVWKQSERFNVPKIAFINKLDRLGANFIACLESMEQRLTVNAVPLVIPLGEGEDFYALADLIRLVKYEFIDENNFTTTNLSDTEIKQILNMREKSLEKIADVNEEFLELYLSNNYQTQDILNAIRQGTIANKICPVLAGSAFKNIGIQALIDAVCDFLPSPTERLYPAICGDEECLLECNESAKLAALVFKVIIENNRRVAFIRIYSGTLSEGQSYYNVNQKSLDKISRIYRIHADRRDQLAKAKAGDIVAVIGLRSAITGDTITEAKNEILLEGITNYIPVISLALEPKNADEATKLDEALGNYIIEDPTFSLEIDEGSGQRLISGMGELHLEVLIERMKREYAINPRVSKQQVVKRETIFGQSQGSAEFDRELNKESHYASISLKITAKERDQGNECIFSLDCTKINPNCVEEVKHGVLDALLCGVATGYPVIDVLVEVEAILKKDNKISPIACRMAGAMAVRDALEKAKNVVLEPIMYVEILVPDDFLGSSISLFNTCGGKIDNLTERSGLKLMQGNAPLSKLFGFSTSLRSATQGRAGLMMNFLNFAEV